MCYGMRCVYETAIGECRLKGTNIPDDAACKEDNEEQEGQYETQDDEYTND